MMLSPEERLEELQRLVRQRDETWQTIFTSEGIDGRGLHEATSHCVAIEGHERTARLLASAFTATPLGEVFSHLLCELDTLRTPRTFRITDVVLEVVSEDFEIDIRLLRSPARYRDVVQARSVVLYLVRRFSPELTLRQLAAVVNRKDHSTIIHALRSFSAQLVESPELLARVTKLEEITRSRAEVKP